MGKYFSILVICCVAMAQIGYVHQEKTVTAPEESVTAEHENSPFQIVADKTPLESGQSEKITCIILSDVTDFSYTASAERGKISNKNLSTFDYEKPKEGVSDTIFIECTDKTTGREYSFSVPMFFTVPATTVLPSDLK